MAKLYAVKRRPADHPVIVHFASADAAFGWAREVPRERPQAREGVLARPAHACPQAFAESAGLHHRRAGHRRCSLPVASDRARIARAFGRAIAAPSANRFGLVSPTTAAHVREDSGSDVDLVLEGGPSEVGIESTIVDLSGRHAGALAAGAHLEERTSNSLECGGGGEKPGFPRHSGGLERHYAPRTPARLVPSYNLDKEIARLKEKVAVLAFSRPDERVDYWLRMPRDPHAYAQKLYAALRELDSAGCEEILIEAPPETPEWAAVGDRLKRACG